MLGKIEEDDIILDQMMLEGNAEVLIYIIYQSAFTFKYFALYVAQFNCPITPTEVFPHQHLKCLLRFCVL